MASGVVQIIEYTVLFILLRAAIKDLKVKYVPLDVVYKLLFVFPLYIAAHILSGRIKNIVDGLISGSITFGVMFIISLLGGILLTWSVKQKENDIEEVELYDLGEIYEQKHNLSIDISIWTIIISFILFLVLEKKMSVCIIVISFLFELFLTLMFEKYDDTIDFYISENKNAFSPIVSVNYTPAIGGGDILILSYLSFIVKKDILNLFVLAVFIQFILLLFFKRKYGREIPFIPAIMLSYLLIIGHAIPFDFWQVIELWKEII